MSTDYANRCNDAQVKQMFTKAAQDALTGKQKLLTFLNQEVNMDEKYMTNDILEGTKSDLTTMQGVISEAENTQLRQTIQQMRNSTEAFQYELFKMAQTKGYYTPAAKATQTEVDTVRTEVSKQYVKLKIFLGKQQMQGRALLVRLHMQDPKKQKNEKK